MIDLKILEKRGVSVDAWKSKFTSDKPDDKVEAFRKRAWGRAQDGISSNMQDFKIYKAIDAAWDTPLRQITPTLLTDAAGESIANDDPKAQNVLKAIQSLDLTKYLIDAKDPKTGKTYKTLDVPTFFQIIIPLVKPYVTIRWARLCNDRNVVPFFKYDPQLNDTKNRLKCSILDHRTDMMATQFNYPEVRKQSVLGMLLYPESYQFIETEWFHEKQLAMENGAEVEKITREGLTYHRPHPTRVYRDKAHPGYTLLTDTGCQWIGYWRIKRYGELASDSTLWNSQRISIGTDWYNSHPAYFSAFASCIMTFPQVVTNQNDAQAKLNSGFYTSDHNDMGTMVVEHFEKIIPADVGLGDYKFPIWMRMLFAGEGTVLYAVPLPGVPVIYYGDAVDAYRDHNASMALEIVPFQDALTNILTQAVLSSKQNLSGATWVDECIVTDDTIKALENVGEAYYRTRKFIRYDSKKLQRAQLDPNKAIFNTSFPWIDTNSLMNTFNVILNMLERVIQISPQEVGSSASHEQSAEEIRRSSAGTGTRLAFASASLDRSTDAWKRQVYTYLMAYGEEEIWAEIPVDDLTQLNLAKLQEMGFTVEDKGEKIATVRGQKTAIALEYFASTRDGADRVDNKAIANSMTQVFMAAMGNPMLAQTIGPEQSINLLNTIIHWLGLPDDFKLRAMPADPAQMQQIMGEVQKAIQSSSQEVLGEVQKALAPIVDQIKQGQQSDQAALQAVQTNTQDIQRIVGILKQITQAPNPTQPTQYDSQAQASPYPGIQNPADQQLAVPPGGPMVPGSY